jgi:PAS domain S-box-containing protein
VTQPAHPNAAGARTGLHPNSQDGFDRLTRLAAQVLQAPVALVNFIDDGRERCVSAYDPSGRYRAGDESPLDSSVCRHVVTRGEPLVIEDAREHPLVHDNPAVRAGRVVAYLGIPLVSPGGHPLGTLCLIDRQPRCWAHAEVEILVDLAQGVVTEIALREEITERKLMEAALQESEGRFRQLAEHVDAVFWLYDCAGGRAIYVSPAFEAIWGRGREAVYADSHTWAEALHPEDRERVLANMDAAREEEYEIEYRIVRPDGEVRWIRDRGFPVRDSRGRVYRTSGLAEDVTEKRSREERMRLLTMTLDSLGQGVSIVDGQTLRGVYANTACARMLGCVPGTYLEHTVGEFLPDEAAALQLAEIQAALEASGEWSGRIWRRRRDNGRVVPLDAVIGAVSGGSGQLLIFTVMHDATEATETERRLRRVERLASVGTLLSGIAHELNNPLHAITNFAHLLLMESRPEGDREALEIMQREADRAASIVSDLRTIARRSRGAEDDSESFDLNEVVRHVLRIRCYTHDSHNIRVDTQLSDGLPSVRGSRSEIEQCLLNLVINAEQAMEGQDAKGIELHTGCDRGFVWVRVQDAGPGIPPEHRERIFDPFWTTRGPGGGTGLGLSLVHTIVEAHGGLVRVESDPGRGAAFTIDLPLATGTGPSAEERRTHLGPSRRLRVLVVDDEDSIRRSLLRFLSLRGHQVDVAAEGAEAIALIDRQEHDPPYDVVLSDLRMPGLGGDQLLQHLRGRSGQMDRRVVFMTGDTAGVDASRILKAARTPVLVKPVPPEYLVAVVEDQAELALAAEQE